MTTETASGQYMTNAIGHLVPVELVAPIDIERDDLVKALVNDAKRVQGELTAFKQRALGDISAFIDLSAEKYKVEYGGDKGNVTLSSFDGRYKVIIAVADRTEHDERLQIAKEMIDKCCHKWGVGVNANYRALVMSAFQVDKRGRINTGRLLELTRLNIDDDEWKTAMQAIIDSIRVVGSKEYVRIYERVGKSNSFQQITLDIAAL
jgi:hypothetical protein